MKWLKLKQFSMENKISKILKFRTSNEGNDYLFNIKWFSNKIKNIINWKNTFFLFQKIQVARYETIIYIATLFLRNHMKWDI